jgi:hypothetical protein
MQPCPSGKTTYRTLATAREVADLHTRTDAHQGLCKPCKTGVAFMRAYDSCTHCGGIHIGHVYPEKAGKQGDERRIRKPKGRTYDLTQGVTLGELLDPTLRERLIAVASD